MDILGIEYTRDFTLDLKSVESKIKSYGTLTINNNITFDLDNIKKTINFVPLLKDNNHFVFKHPLGRTKKVKNGYEVYIGHQKITFLKSDYFPMQCNIQDIEITIDKNITKKVNFGKILDFKEGFLIKKTNARINIIGYSKNGVTSEEEIYLTADEIDKNFSLDKNNQSFRVEVYQGENFCGMVTMKKGN